MLHIVSLIVVIMVEILLLYYILKFRTFKRSMQGHFNAFPQGAGFD